MTDEPCPHLLEMDLKTGGDSNAFRTSRGTHHESYGPWNVQIVTIASCGSHSKMVWFQAAAAAAAPVWVDHNPPASAAATIGDDAGPEEIFSSNDSTLPMLAPFGRGWLVKHSLQIRRTPSPSRHCRHLFPGVVQTSSKRTPSAAGIVIYRTNLFQSPILTPRAFPIAVLPVLCGKGGRF